MFLLELAVLTLPPPPNGLRNVILLANEGSIRAIAKSMRGVACLKKNGRCHAFCFPTFLNSAQTMSNLCSTNE